MANNTVELKKGKAEFKLVGRLVLSDRTFTLNSKSASGYISNQCYIGVDCGNGNVVHGRMFGGYKDADKAIIYAHGIKYDEKFKRNADDYKNKIQVSWKDRHSVNILKNIGPSCFTTIALGWTKNEKGNDVPDDVKFLTQYDAIAYMASEIEKMTDEEKKNINVMIKGDLNFNYYNGKVTVQKNITSIRVTNLPADKFGSKFTQTVYINKDHIGERDDVTNTILVNGVVPEYINKVDDIEVKGIVPLKTNMYLDLSKKAGKVILNFFRGENNYGRYELIGKFSDIGNTETVDLSEYSDDVKALLESGDWDEDEATPTTTSGSNKSEDMIITNIRVVECVSENGIPCKDISKESDVYMLSELDSLHDEFMSKISKNETADEDNDDLPFDLDDDDYDNDEDDDWLTSLED